MMPAGPIRTGQFRGVLAAGFELMVGVAGVAPVAVVVGVDADAVSSVRACLFLVRYQSAAPLPRPSANVVVVDMAGLFTW
jgi:hypothetical protein